MSPVHRIVHRIDRYRMHLGRRFIFTTGGERRSWANENVRPTWGVRALEVQSIGHPANGVAVHWPAASPFGTIRREPSPASIH